jgi:DNA-binding response OmpR family regulator
MPEMGIVLGNLELDRERFQVRIDGRAVPLTFVQFELLYALASSADRPVSSRELLEQVWGPDTRDTRKLRVQVSRLRKKLAGSRPWRIETVTKRGYALVNSEAEVRLPAFVLAHAPVARPLAGEGGSL